MRSGANSPEKGVRYFSNSGLLCKANIMHDLNRCPSFFQSETLPSECLLIDQRVKIGEASTEFDLFPVQCDATISALPLGFDLRRDVVDVNREKPGYSGFL